MPQDDLRSFIESLRARAATSGGREGSAPPETVEPASEPQEAPRRASLKEFVQRAREVQDFQRILEREGLGPHVPQEKFQGEIEKREVDEAAAQRLRSLPSGSQLSGMFPARPVNIDVEGARQREDAEREFVENYPDTPLDEMPAWKRMMYQASSNMLSGSPVAWVAGPDWHLRGIAEKQLRKESGGASPRSSGGMVDRPPEGWLGNQPVAADPSEEAIARRVEEMQTDAWVDQERHLSSKVAARAGGTLQFLINLATMRKAGVGGGGFTGEAIRMGTHEALAKAREGLVPALEGLAYGGLAGMGLRTGGYAIRGVAGKVITGTGKVAERARGAVTGAGLGAAIGGVEGGEEAVIDALLFGGAGALGKLPIGPKERVARIRELQETRREVSEKSYQDALKAKEEWEARRATQDVEVEKARETRETGAEPEPVVELKPEPKPRAPSAPDARADAQNMTWEEWGDRWEGKFRPAIRTSSGKIVTGHDHWDAFNKAEHMGEEIPFELGKSNGWVVGSEFILSDSLKKEGPRDIYDYFRGSGTGAEPEVKPRPAPTSPAEETLTQKQERFAKYATKSEEALVKAGIIGEGTPYKDKQDFIRTLGGEIRKIKADAVAAAAKGRLFEAEARGTRPTTISKSPPPLGASPAQEAKTKTFEKWNKRWQGWLPPAVRTDSGRLVVGRDHQDAIRRAASMGERVSGDPNTHFGWKMRGTFASISELPGQSQRDLYNYLRSLPSGGGKPPSAQRLLEKEPDRLPETEKPVVEAGETLKYDLPTGVKQGSAHADPRVSDPRHLAKSIAVDLGKDPHLKMTREKIDKQIDKAYNTLATLGKVGRHSGRGIKIPKGARGQYHLDAERTDVRMRGNLETASHELIHHLQRSIYGPELKGLETELDPFAKELGPLASPGHPLIEGMAEFGRLYMTDPRTAKEYAPDFYKHFEGMVDAHSQKLSGQLLRIQNMYRQLAEGGGGYEGIIHRPPSRWELPTLTDVKEGMHRIYYGFFQRANQVWRIAHQNEWQKGRKLGADEHPGIQMSLLPGRAELGDAFISKGIVDGKTSRVIPGTKPLLEVFAPLKGGKNELQFSGYLIASRVRAFEKKAGDLNRRAQEIRDEMDEPGAVISKAKRASMRKTIRSLEQSAENYWRMAKEKMEQANIDGFVENDNYIAAREKEFPYFRKVVEDLMEWNRGVLQYAVDKGAITAESMAKMVDFDVYAPWQTVRTGPKRGAAGAGAAVVDTPSPTKRIKGGHMLPIIDPVISFFQKAYLIPRIADRAAVGRLIIDRATELQGYDRWMTKIERPQVVHKLQMEEVRRNLEDMFGKEAVKAMDLTDTAMIFRPDYMFPRLEGRQIISVVRNGEREFWEINDKQLYDAIRHYGEADLPSEVIFKRTMQVMRTITHAKRFSIVVGPAFWFANTGRDYMVRGAQTGQWNPLDILMGWKEIIAGRAGKSEIYDLYHTSGAAMSALMEIDMKSIRTRLRDITRGRAVANRVIHHPREFMRLWFETSESPGRITTFAKRLRNPLPQDKGKPAAELARAAFEARESTLDFARHGAWMRGMAQITGFLNPTLQGADKFVRTAKDHPLRMAMGLSGLASATTLFWVNNMAYPFRKEAYHRLSDEDKNAYWVLFTGSQDDYDRQPTEAAKASYVESHMYKIPKPWEYGWFGGTMVERLILEPHFKQFKNQHQTESGLQKVLESTGMLVPNLIPDALLPLAEGWTPRGWSFFRGRYVVPLSEEKAHAPLQYGPETSEIAKAAGAALNISPRKIHNSIAVGELFREGLAISDDIIRWINDDEMGRRPKRGMRDAPFIRNIIRRFRGYYPSTSAAPIQEFYDHLDELEASLRDFNLVVKRGEMRKAPAHAGEVAETTFHPRAGNEEWLKKNSSKIPIVKLARKTAQTLSEKRAEMQEVYNSDLSEKQKWNLHVELVFDQIEAAEAFLDTYLVLKNKIESKGK